MKKVKVLTFALLIVFSGTGYGTAGSLDIPNVFTPETPARADSVNENFSAVEVSVDDNASMITSLQNAHSSTRVGYYSIHPRDFTFIEDQTAIDFVAIDTALMCISSPADICLFGAGLHLPHGAILKNYTVHYDDTSSTYDIDFIIVRSSNVSVGGNAYLGRVNEADFSAGANSVAKQFNVAYPFDVINNVDHSYSIFLKLYPDVYYNRAVIEYEYTLN